MTKLFPALCASLLVSACSNIPPPMQADVLISQVDVIDVRSGDINADQQVAIRGDQIIWVGKDAEHINATTQLDGTDQYIMPGLWDMHVHFGGGEKLIAENQDLLPLYLAYGVTAVRDAAADISDSVLTWRAAINNNELLGPTLFTSGPKLEGKNSIWAGDLEVETEAEMNAALDQLEAMDVDFIKITDSALTPDLYLKAVQEVKKRGLPISGHIPFALSVTHVSKAGLDGIEHMPYLLKAGARNEAEISAKVRSGELSYWSALPIIRANFDEQTALSKYRVLAENDTAVVPTLIGSQIIAFIDEDDHLNDPELDLLGPGLKATYSWRVERAAQKAAADAKEITERKARFRATRDLLPLLDQAGVTIMAGTDTGYLNSYIYPGKALHDELAIYVDGGLSPLRALQSAILTGPKWLGKEAEYGAVEAGKKADLLLLGSNPLEDISHTRDIRTLISRGQVYNSAALQAMLDAAKAKVATAQAQ
ncbi:amidohydrolase family protein [Pseudoalteromonas sp. T1lg22]|uniref:amidohydrolase family protein n=1 Tax=Pseudoalteromonas sp. T1lg22 TaxID=2077096 RepID=UPI000CF65410|nr:amidohydrolase family protein [Pseudoalteromonas sp. T1lg22]